ncbi:MAG: NAD kinase [Flavobacteriales bacterium]|nr:NAD kinase [Flavobacteriales bacterium]
MVIGIYARHLRNKIAVECLKSLTNYLDQLRIETLFHENLYQSLKENKIKLEHKYEVFSTEEISKTNIEYLLCIGGDGTMLDTLNIVRETGIPVLGFNTGRLGYLATSHPNEVKKAVDELVKKAYHIDKRSLLKLEADQELFGGFAYALNDFVIHKKDSSSMITVHTYLNGEFMNTYWADGLIVATPTGSSAYSLSCGGPILIPQSASFAITPIAPHNLSVRPVVIPDNTVLSFEIEGRVKSYLISLDSRNSSIKKGTQIAVRKANFMFNMIRLSNENYLDSLRNKMMWGVDARN